MQNDGSWGLQGQQAIQGPSLTLTFVYEVLRGTADPLVVDVDGGQQRLIEERAVLESVTVKHDTVAPGIVAEYNRVLAGFNGSALRQLVGEAGDIVELKSELLGGIEPPKELKDGMDAALDVQRRFPFRLPPIPVGRGAKWRFREKIQINGVDAVQVADMTLRALDEQTAAIHFTVRLEAARQEVPHPFSPGETASLDVFRGDGDGELTLDRLTGIALRGRFATTARLTLSGDVAGKRQTATFFAASVVTSRAEILDESHVIDAGAEG
jgi:hypothetical protein